MPEFFPAHADSAARKGDSYDLALFLRGYLGAAEWLLTAYLLVQQRLALGLPWQRMALILCAVAVFTAASALVFRSAALRARFGGSSG